MRTYLPIIAFLVAFWATLALALGQISSPALSSGGFVVGVLIGGLLAYGITRLVKSR